LNGTWKEYNTTGPAKVAVNVNLEGSGIIEVKNALATIEELYWVNVTREIKKETNASANDTNASAETTAEATNASGNDSNATAPVIEYETVQKQKKKKHEKKLVVTRMDYKPRPLQEAGIEDAKKVLDLMIKEEEEVQGVLSMRNELEAAIYGSRDKVEADSIVKVSTEEQRTEVLKLCTEYDDYIAETADAKKVDYETRYNKLKDLLGPMEERSIELESRDDVADNMNDALQKMNEFHDALKKNKTWVNETKLETAVKTLTELEEWWSKKLASQKSLPLHEAPAFTKAEVTDHVKKTKKDWDKAIKSATKKPKEEKKKANATAGDAKKEPEVKEEAMPADAAAVQAEIKDVAAKKAAAVENEDFDAAQLLKQREAKLKAHLDTLEKKEL